MIIIVHFEIMVNQDDNVKDVLDTRNFHCGRDSHSTGGDAPKS
jgi:hypothetical protein